MQKNWIIEKEPDHERSIVFDSEKAQISTTNWDQNEIFGFGNWLKTRLFWVPLEVDFEILQLIVQYSNPSDFDEEELRFFRFWKYLNVQKLPTKERFNAIKAVEYHTSYFWELTPHGAKTYYLKKGNEIIFDFKQRLCTVFFNGPHKSLVLKDRIKIRQYFLNAFSADSGFTKKDTFPLFDYTKIPKRSYEIELDFSSGRFWSLTGWSVLTGGWDHGASGSYSRSIESEWPDFPSLSGNFEKHKEEIKALVEAAIINE